MKNWKAPNVYLAEDIQNWNCQSGVQREDGSFFWCLARPCGPKGLRLMLRVRAAWSVFCGRCDVVRWGDSQK